MLTTTPETSNSGYDDPGPFPVRSVAIRLFLTCWLVYCLHFATNIVREIYPAMAIGDHLSFRVDEYAGLHPDIFELEGRGWYINANPGASMLAAIPYAILRPLIDLVVKRVQRQRAASGTAEPPHYDSPWPMAQEFYARAWSRGYDVKFGLAALVMQTLCMAPISALGVVAMFWLLRRLFHSGRTALWLALLYAFATPVFFRTGFLNHNMILGHVAFLGFLALWNPWQSDRWSRGTRYFAGGLAGGFCLLLDYGGVILLGGLFLYAVADGIARGGRRLAVRDTLWYGLGALGPILLLWFYQWRCFGNPFYPPQRWMSAVSWIDVGYQGFGLPDPALLWNLLFDYRYGLFTSAPLFLLALAVPFLPAVRERLGARQLWALAGFVLAVWLFYGGVQYTQLQFNTGVRYLAAIFPFVFILAAMVFARLPRWAAYSVGVVAVAESWCLAMYRDVERGLGVLDPVIHIFLGGFQLPVLTTISRMHGPLEEHLAGGVSPLPLFVLTGAILFGVWTLPLSTNSAQRSLGAGVGSGSRIARSRAGRWALKGKQ